MRYVIGIDAGGTKTVGVLADEHGEIRAEARGGGANLQVHGKRTVEEVFSRVIGELDPPGPVAAVCLGVAGVNGQGGNRILRGVVRRLGHNPSIEIVNDAYIALVAGSPERVGIVLVAGTGSIAYGIDSRGCSARAGGWGYLLADEGSGFWLGHQALRRSVRAADGRGPETSLGDKIGARLGVDVPAGLLPWTYGEAAMRYRFAELAPLVTEAAEEGDEVAGELLDEAAVHLAVTVSSVARQLTFDGPYDLVLAGGVLRASAPLSRRVEVLVDLPQARVSRLAVEPAMGAVKVALDYLGSSLTGAG